MYKCRYCHKSYHQYQSRFRHENDKHPEEVEARHLAKSEEKQKKISQRLEEIERMINDPHALDFVDYLRKEHFVQLMRMHVMADRIALCCSILTKSVFRNKLNVLKSEENDFSLLKKKGRRFNQ
jgi:uncharacterized protein involved in tolerance to divalent cations